MDPTQFGHCQLLQEQRLWCHTIGCLFVDDTDLYAMEEGQLDTEEAVIEEAQNEIDWWSWFLCVTGEDQGPKTFLLFPVLYL
mgnify:CR=1 FL=1